MRTLYNHHQHRTPEHSQHLQKELRACQWSHTHPPRHPHPGTHSSTSCVYGFACPGISYKRDRARHVTVGAMSFTSAGEGPNDEKPKLESQVVFLLLPPELHGGREVLQARSERGAALTGPRIRSVMESRCLPLVLLYKMERKSAQSLKSRQKSKDPTGCARTLKTKTAFFFP